jgi:glycerate kinase
MKIVIAPDSFKGCMRSPDICKAIKKGILSISDKIQVETVPMADGGEGTMEAAVSSTNGKLHKLEVNDPLGRKISAEFGILGNSNTAVMEMASASGLELLKKEELNPLKTTTYGTGEIIRHILDIGIKNIIIGIGGSATVDGGSGMAQALGYRLLDKNGNELTCGCSGAGLADLSSIDSSKVHPMLKEVNIKVACDVTNPLLGENGAAKVFAPQKGASPEMVEELEANMKNYSEVLIKAGMLDDVESPGDGAAGGLGTGLRAFCNAEMVSGAQLMIDITGLKEKLKNADIIITGEGCTDSQTSSGKLCAVIAETARDLNVPVMLFSGALKGEAINLNGIFDAAFSICTGPMTLDEALASTEKNLYLAGQNIAGIMLMKNK